MSEGYKATQSGDSLRPPIERLLTLEFTFSPKINWGDFAPEERRQLREGKQRTARPTRARADATASENEWERRCGRERGKRKISHAGRTEEEKLLSSWVCDAWAWVLKGVARKLKQTNGGAQRYTTNHRERKTKVRGNMTDIPGLWEQWMMRPWSAWSICYNDYVLSQKTITYSKWAFWTSPHTHAHLNSVTPL